MHMLQEVKESPEALHVQVSQYEVYNEQIYDLLAEDTGAVLGQRPALRLKEDSQGRIFVRGLTEVWFGALYCRVATGLTVLCIHDPWSLDLSGITCAVAFGMVPFYCAGCSVSVPLLAMDLCVC